MADGRERPACLALQSIVGRWRAGKPRPYGSDRYINVGAHKIVSITTNATVSRGQTFRSSPPGVKPGGGFTCLIIIGNLLIQSLASLHHVPGDQLTVIQ